MLTPHSRNASNRMTIHKRLLAERSLPCNVEYLEVAVGPITGGISKGLSGANRCNTNINRAREGLLGKFVRGSTDRAVNLKRVYA